MPLYLFTVPCPFPVGSDTRCFVADGGLSIYAKAGNTSDDLAWVDSMVQEILQEAMDGGELDDLQASIDYVRYIPPGTSLIGENGTANNSAKHDGSGATAPGSVQTGDNNGKTALSSAPVWTWILGGFGFIGLAVLTIVGFAAYKRRHREENLNSFDSPSKSMASRRKGSPLKSPRKGLGSFPVNPVEIVDDNSEMDDAEIFQDSDSDSDDVDSNDPEQTSKSKRPFSWRKVPEPQPDEESKELTRLEINATDPNQPVVRPVLDEESETYINGVV